MRLINQRIGPRRIAWHRAGQTARLEFQERVAASALLWEGVWRFLWRPLGVAGLFVALAFFDILPRLGDPLHLLVLALFIVGFGLAVWRGLQGLTMPTQEQARRRLERDNRLDHRPLTLLQDNLAAGRGEPESEVLWQAHIDKTIGSLGRVQVGLPSPDLARRDPMAFRFAVILVLIVAFATGFGDLSNRFARAVTPSLAVFTGSTPARLELWMTPPDYTGLPPAFIALGADRDGQADSADEVIFLPVGSKIIAQVHDGSGTPTLFVGDTSWDLEARDERSWFVEASVVPFTGTDGESLDTEIEVTQAGRTLGTWPVRLMVDRPPVIAFAEAPEAAAGDSLAIAYLAADDFGIDRVTAWIRRIDQPTQSFELALTLPRRIEGEPLASFNDLTAHRWAGLPVDIRLEARDAIGQLGVSEFAAVVLPERQFSHRVAREIIALRKMLTRDPSQRLNVARDLERLADGRSAYGDDFVVYLSLIVARSRLVYNPPPMTPWRTYTNADLAAGEEELVIREVQSLLWDVALRVEDGGLSLAERALRELQRRVQQAMEDNASEEEIQALLDQLSAALDRLFEAAAEYLRQALERGEIPFNQVSPEDLALRQQDLQDLIDRARELSELGSRDAAQELLSQLQRMLDGLQNAPQFGNQQQGEDLARELMSELLGIIEGQQGLLDETFQREQSGGDEGQDGDRANREGADTQERLRRELGEFMRQFGEAMGTLPDEFGDAEGAMRRSTEALEDGQPGQSIGPQGDALEALRQGGRAAAEALAEALAQNPGGGAGLWGFAGRQGRPRPGGLDPFGRPLEGDRGLATGDVDIPDESDIQRAREILEELRHRAGDRTRPTEELDYLRRLLRRF